MNMGIPMNNILIYNLAFLLSDGYKRTYSSYISDIPVPFRLMSVQELTQYDMIAFCGGNAHTLLSEINRTGFSKPLKQAIENGLVYLGISAGSMIAAGNFSDGLGYLANPLIPHAEKESPFGDISKNDLIELADGQTVLIVNNGELVPSARSNCTTLPKQEYRLAGWLHRSATALCQRCEPLFR